MQLLHVDSAITGDQSVSRQLTARTVAAWQAAHPGTTVQYLDLAQQAPSHLSAQSLGAFAGLFGFATGGSMSSASKRSSGRPRFAFSSWNCASARSQSAKISSVSFDGSWRVVTP